jgi:hypothetical protein
VVGLGKRGLDHRRGRVGFRRGIRDWRGFGLSPVLASRLGNAGRRQDRDARLVRRITGGQRFVHGCVLYDWSAGDEFGGPVDLVLRAEAPRPRRMTASIHRIPTQQGPWRVAPARAETIVIPLL